MLTVEQVQGRSTHNRRMIKPRVSVEVKNEEQRQQIARVAKRVISEHYEVLAALKNR